MQVPEGMRRVALRVEYAGASFHGFQKQSSTEKTVQCALERALTRVAAEPISLVCAGRTDAGVHATAQTVHFDTLSERPSKAWVQGANCHLPDEVRILAVQEMPFAFHARFGALSRTYRYIIHCSSTYSAHMANQVTWVNARKIQARELNVAEMAMAGTYLLGRHDFTSFRASQCQASSPVRELKNISVTQRGAFVVVEVEANAFLHHMVRNIVGCLLKVGSGKESSEWVSHVLAAKNRNQAAETAPSAGLYFVNVEYPEHFGLPKGPVGPVFLIGS